MKRLLGLAVLLVVLAACVPSYGYFLIYNVSASVKGINNDTPATISAKGYLVLNLDGGGNLVDANLILYGKDSGKNKVYVVLNQSDSYGFLDTALWYQLQGQGDFAVFNFWTYGSPGSPFNFEGLVLGKGAFKDIGFGANDKAWVATSLKGTAMVWNKMIFDAGDDIAGTGSVSATLYVAGTKYVNANGWTQDEIMNGNGDDDGIILIVRGKHYNPAQLPPL